MERKTYILEFEDERYLINVPVKDGMILTNQFCPDELLQQTNFQFYPVNGEPEEAFLQDCRRMIEGMQQTGEEKRLERHIGALMMLIMQHVASFGKILFDNLLIYLDIFSLLLNADGFEEDEIRKLYPRILRSIIDLYPDDIFYNKIEILKFSGSRYDEALDTLLKND